MYYKPPRLKIIFYTLNSTYLFDCYACYIRTYDMNYNRSYISEYKSIQL